MKRVISRKFFEKDIEKAIQKLNNLVLQENYKFFGKIGNIEIDAKNHIQVETILKNYKLPWYKISVVFKCICVHEKFKKNVKSQNNEFKEHFILFFCGIPITFIFILYQTKKFIYKKIFQIFH
jgi:hypothetical protein